VVEVDRLSRFAPEEIVGSALLVIVLLFVAMRPTAITHQFQSPYATPAPGGGPALRFVPQSRPAASPPALLLFQRELARP
jgi:hypothetical protein